MTCLGPNGTKSAASVNNISFVLPSTALLQARNFGQSNGETSILGAESHPLHLHGFNFFMDGEGLGNYDPSKDPAKFSLIDPIERSILGVPSVIGALFAL
ncbi:Multicopper oxidase, C-terminal [Dillenia turbinata]|uniref:Multicopper oxidase, C-terminal n=1 Tax=Dillenia turbinata TaxID=194707 RepID=A0AAN8W1G0_9MAGN